jgi:dimethylhistidine N-methyltransferase/glutamate--cysteine ligase
MRNLRRPVAAARNPVMLAEVKSGLALEQKELSPKYFYDARGSRLFEEITTLDEYYPTRTERAMLIALMPEIIREVKSVSLIELGAGSAEKSRIILDAMREAGSLETYVPIDVSAEFLTQTARRLRVEYPGTRVSPAVADITGTLNLPIFPRPSLFAFLGSTIGNFEDGPAIALLKRIATEMQPGDRFLMGADLVKDRAVLEAAYNDSREITAQFNLNVLRVLNRELGTTFDEGAFRHTAFFNPVQSRIEMHLIATRRQVVDVPGLGEVPFREGESIRTEISRKFTRPMLEEMFSEAGLAIERWDTDANNWYALMTATVAPARRRGWVTGHGRLVATLREDLRANAFALNPGGAFLPDRIGAEVELIALRAEDRRPCMIEGEGTSSLRFLRDYGTRLGWVEEVSPKGTPRFQLPGQGTLSFEPGGQLEFSTIPSTSASKLLANLQGVVPPLISAAGSVGIELLEVGIDPVNPIESAPMQLVADRYTRMARYFASIGPAGARMMRQTAAFHLNLDFGGENMLRWRVLNAAAPYLTAIFANSRRYAGRETENSSNRALAWRGLDPARTGILPAGPVAEDEYLDFALGAPAMLLDPTDGIYTPFGEHWTAQDVTLEEWHEHLSTLFPEIRPRGYLEVRCIDAVASEWYAAPVVLLTGLLYHRASLVAADDLLGSPNPDLLHRAAAAGLQDPAIGRIAGDLFTIGLKGAEGLSRAFLRAEDLEQARDYFRRFTQQGHSPSSFTTQSS